MIYKKKVFAEIQTDFLAKIGNSNAFSGRITASISQLRHPNSFGGGLFSFFQQNSASKAPKTCDFAYFILYRPMGRGGSSPPPPWLRYWLYAPLLSVNLNVKSLSSLSISCKLDALYKKIFTLLISSYSESCYLNILLIMLLLECFLASLQSENTTSADQHCHYLQNFSRVITQNY